MKAAIRFILLVLALAGFLLFFSFNIQNIGPSQSVTVGFNLSPWFQWSRIKGIARFTENWHVEFISWSVAGGVAGVVLLILRSRIKG